jgi:hypothetical protein
MPKQVVLFKKCGLEVQLIFASPSLAQVLQIRPIYIFFHLLLF